MEQRPVCALAITPPRGQWLRVHVKVKVTTAFHRVKLRIVQVSQVKVTRARHALPIEA